MSFHDEQFEFEYELDTYYSTYPTDLSQIETELHRLSSQHPEWLPYMRKAAGYEILARHCPLKVFRHFPFYFEFDAGKPRTDLGAGGIGGWMKREPFGQELQDAGILWWQPFQASGLSYGWPVLDDNHHSIGNDNVFRHGLKGLIRQAEDRLAEAATEKEHVFLQSVVAGNEALIAIAERFADEAERLLREEDEPHLRQRLQRIADNARRAPAEPPATFYEALNTILFMREVVQSLEGNGNSVFGHLDRILLPYYERDLAEGRIAREEARDLLRFFLAFSDVRFGMRQVHNHVGTNSTVVIGGCDQEGSPVFNDLTRMIVEVYIELKLVDPKLNARISQSHPAAYFDLLAKLTLSGSNSLAIFNDEVIIEANAKMGKALHDSRLYVGGGCQENLLENTEVNSRASIYLNLAQVLLVGFFPEGWPFLIEHERLELRGYDGCSTFESLYATFLDNLKAVVDLHIQQRNRTEREGWRYNPCPLHSSTLSDCIENAKDMMEGGARYNFGSVSLTGIGTLVDSLYAIREVVFDRKQLPMSHLRKMLASDFAGEETFRQRLVHRVAKFGHDDEALREFSAQVFADVARVSSGSPNARGGRYEASLFSFRSFTTMGTQTGATPDGRKAGEHLSPGMSPSVLALGKECSFVQALRSLEPLDLTLYPVVAVLDLKLPAEARQNPDYVVTVLKVFLDYGGSVLQVNCVDPATLLEARAHPEHHPDLVVRVSGYSAYFNTLPEAIQDEIIERTLVRG